MNVSRILEIALGDVGRKESPPHSNHVAGITLPGADYPWCAVWISGVLLRAGIDCPMILSARKLVEYWQEHGVLVEAASAPYRRGDLILTERHDERGALVGHHVALVVSDDGRKLVVVAGNHRDEVGVYEERRGRVVGSARVCAD